MLAAVVSTDTGDTGFEIVRRDGDGADALFAPENGRDGGGGKTDTRRRHRDDDVCVYVFALSATNRKEVGCCVFLGGWYEMLGGRKEGIRIRKGCCCCCGVVEKGVV